MESQARQAAMEAQVPTVRSMETDGYSVAQVRPARTESPAEVVAEAAVVRCQEVKVSEAEEAAVELAAAEEKVAQVESPAARPSECLSSTALLSFETQRL